MEGARTEASADSERAGAPLRPTEAAMADAHEHPDEARQSLRKFGKTLIDEAAGRLREFTDGVEPNPDFGGGNSG